MYDVTSSCFSERQAVVLQLFSLSKSQRALATVLWNLSSPKQFYTPEKLTAGYAKNGSLE